MDTKTLILLFLVTFVTFVTFVKAESRKPNTES